MKLQLRKNEQWHASRIENAGYGFGGGSGGGGGGSNPDTRYANLDALYGVQTQASRYMLDNAMPHIPRLTENSAAMVDEAMDGTLGNRMRGVAGADAEQALSANLAATDRNNAKYGAEFNPNRRAQLSRVAAVDGANVKANAMNKASQWSEDQKWNRNASMFGQVMGMNNGAMQGMSSATSGMTTIANQQAANDRANAAGYGQAGAAFSNALFKADGGFIKGGKSRGFGLRLNSAKLANGGNAWEAYKAANPVKPMISGSSGRSGGTNPYMAMLSGAAPGMLGAGLRDVMKGDKSGIIKTAKDVLSKGKTWVTSADQAQGASNTGLAFETNADIVAGNMDTGASLGADVGTTAATELGSAAASAAATEAGVQVGSDVLAQSTMEALGSAAVQEGSQQAAMLAAQDAAFLVADGGYIPDRKKGRGLRLAMGGMPTMQKMSVADNSGVSGLDSNQSLSVARMDEAPKQPVNAKPAGTVATGYQGKTDGMGETSPNDPDGFGKNAPDNRHMAGKATMQAIGNWLGGTYGGMAGSALAEVFHPAGEAISRAVITTGDKMGGPGGALVLDPIGTTASGKYTNEELAKGHLSVAAGMPWLSKFADGGDVEPQQRIDFKPGGDVQGPGTETSDDIPAWLSAGEIVENAEAVKLAGKDALLAINQAGRDVREGNASPQEARQEIGQVMIERGKQLAGESIEAGIKQVARRAGARRGIGLKRGGCVPKLAGGGLLGGNLGIAMGAGVEQLNRQQALDMQQQQIDLQRAANQRAEEQASRAATEHEWKINDRKTQDGLRAELGDIEKRAALGDTNEYMAGKQDEAKAAAALQGIEYQPLTEEQRKVIASTPGLAKMTPHLRYEMDMQRAAALRKAGDFKSAEAYADKATSQATGDFMRSLMSGDFRSAGKLYNIYPNGHTIDGMEAGPDDDHITVIDKGERKKVSRYDLMTGALAQLNPQAAANMLLQDKKLDSYMKRIEAQNEAKLAGIAARATAGGSRSSGSGKDDSDPTASLLDRKKFNEAMGFKDEDGATADKAYSFYAQLAAANRKNGDLSAATNAELLRLSRDMATGGKKPAVDFDNNTLGFIHGVRDEGGNFRPLKSTGVRGDAIDTTTGQPFFDAKTIRTKELAGLDAFSKRDPEGFAQAARLSQAKSERELLAMASNPQLAPFANAAILMQRYRDAPPTNKAAPGGGEAGPGVTGNRPGPFGMAADAFGGTLGFIKDGVRDALVNNLEGEHKWSQQPKPQ